ncbi:MAG: multiheme c-type cytochrome [Bacteroidia bacterium]
MFNIQRSNFKLQISNFKFGLRLLITFCFGCIVLIIAFLSCTSTQNKSEELFYLNHNDTVDYVGLATCASCHTDKAVTFLHTGMGSSFNIANHQKSAADFLKNHVVYDTVNDLYYKPFWKNDVLFFMEYRLEGNDTIHKRIEKIDYIIGSGQHTNSHLILRNGFVYQAPMTWYSQEKHWGLPPGFEKGRNSRFARIIDEECMSCHNSMPKVETESDNKFISIGKGIDCERCHGPGEMHVNLRMQGKAIKSKDGIDRTIINPAKLSWQLQVDLCQRCHLQGNAVLQVGKRFTQFKPGMKLSDYFDVFMPKYENNESEIIMASHAQRLQLSKCFIKSNKGGKQLSLTCINCHNPHVSVKETGVAQFNNACKKCHSKDEKSLAQAHLIKEQNNNCVQCHMPSSGTIDIPHVTVHDHYIQKPFAKTIVNKGRLKGLYCINNDNPTTESSIKAYLSYYEKFNPDDLYLKEARKLLDKNKSPVLEIYYWYLVGDDKKVIEFVKNTDNSKLDAWGFYRIGQSYLNISNFEKAETFLQKALKIQPKNFEFIYKLSITNHHLGKKLDEEQNLKSVIALNPNHTQALNSLGYLYFKNEEMNKAQTYYLRCLTTNPDFLPVLKNLFDFYLASNNKSMAIEMAKRILKKDLNNKVLKEFLNKNS